MRAKKKKLALVIGAGSVKCAAALGLWKALERENIHFDMIVGCSGGSIYAAAMAMGFSLQECIESTKKLWNRSITEGRNWRALASAILPGLLKFDYRFSLMSDRAMLRSFRSVFGEKTFADTVTPLYVVATDFETGESVAQHEGRLVDALRASVAIPYIWSAWKHNGRVLIDGAASNPLPVDVPIREGVDIILAMGFEAALPSRVRSISRYAFYINSLMTNNLMHANFAFHNAAHHAEMISIFPDFDRPVRLFDTEQFPYVVEQGERTMLKHLPYLKRLLES